MKQTKQNILSQYPGGIPDKISQLLGDGQDIDSINSDGDTALHLAIKLHNIPLAAFLIESGAKLDIENIKGESAFALSIKYNNEYLAQELIERGAALDAKDDDGYYIALHWAIENSHDEIIDLILDRDFDLEVQNLDLETPLHLATSLDSQKSAEKLILKGANPDAQDSDRKTPAELKPEYFSNEFILQLFSKALEESDTESIDNLLKHYRYLYNTVIEEATKNPEHHEMLIYLWDKKLPEKKITQRELDELIKLYSLKEHFVLKDLLAELNYSNDLRDLEIDGNLIKDPHILDLSGLNLQNTKLYKLYANEKILFNGSNLTQANITLINTDSTIVDFTKAKLISCFVSGLNMEQSFFDETVIQQAMIIGSKTGPVTKLSDEQKLNTIDLVIDQKSAFSQTGLFYGSQLFDHRGICYGLCIELARYTLMSQEKKEGYGDYIEKLNRKISNPSTNFIFRVQSYQKYLQHPDTILDIGIKNVLNDNFLSSLPESLKQSDIIGCGVSATNEHGHIFTITRIRDEHKEIIGYKVFDPNFGEISCSNEKEANQQIHLLYECYQQNVKKGENYFKAYPLDQIVKDWGLIHPQQIGLTSEIRATNKAKKYSPLSYTDYIYKNILNNKASPEQEQQVTDLIQKRSLEEINKSISLPNQRSTNLLMLTIEAKKYKLIETLIKKGVDLDYINSQGSSPLSLAITMCDKKSIDILLKSGANPDIETYGNPYLNSFKNKFCGDQAIAELFKESIVNNDIKTLDKLLIHNAKFKTQIIDPEGNTLLSYAIEQRSSILANLIKRDFQTNKPEHQDIIDAIKDTKKALSADYSTPRDSLENKPPNFKNRRRTIQT